MGVGLQRQNGCRIFKNCQFTPLYISDCASLLTLILFATSCSSTQFVHLRGCRSNLLNTVCGVNQGSLVHYWTIIYYHVLLEVLLLCILSYEKIRIRWSIGIARRAKRAISCDSVLSEAVSQTKYCCYSFFAFHIA